MGDPHFVERGLFAHSIDSDVGQDAIPALPLPIAPEFRDTPGGEKGAEAR